MGVFGFIRNLWVHLGAFFGSSGSSAVIGVHTGGRGVQAKSLGSLGCALGVVGVRPGGPRVRLGSLGSLGFAMEFVLFVWGRLVNWGARCCSSGSSRVAVFIGVRPEVGRVRPESLGCDLGVVWVHWGALWGSSGSSGIAWFIGLHRGGRTVHPGSLGSLEFAIRLIEFIRGC